MIREARFDDAVIIANIYNYYIENTIITFENTIVNGAEIKRRMQKVLDAGYPYLVYEEDGAVVGYAYLDQWRTRKAYDITLETSIYLDLNNMKNGIGTQLYEELIARARALRIHSLIGVVSHPNEASYRLHQKLGFTLVGTFKEVGEKFGRLIDVEFWQLIL